MTQPEAAVAILHTRSKPESILLMRRSERLGDSWSGQWSLPGGHAEAPDPDAVHTALRELEEECGIRLTPQALTETLPHAVARRRTEPFLVVAPFVFRVDTELATTLDPREAVGTHWIPLDRLRNRATHALRAVPGRPPDMLFPCIELDGAPLWGFTYRLLTDWLRPRSEAPLDGLAAARKVLAAVCGFGVRMKQAWTDRTAVVAGEIPVEALRQLVCAPAPDAAINMLELRPDCVRLLGPEWEEYRIVTA